MKHAKQQQRGSWFIDLRNLEYFKTFCTMSHITNTEIERGIIQKIILDTIHKNIIIYVYIIQEITII